MDTGKTSGVGPGSQNTAAAIKDHTARLAGLYEEYFDRIGRYVYVRIGNQKDAEDIVGETFIEALQFLKSYREQGIPMQGWLFRIAHNLTVDYLRKKGKHRTVPLDSVVLPDNFNPAEAVERKLEIEEVNRAMEQLTEDQRKVIQLRFFGGLSSREVAGVLNKSDGSVREMQSAGMQKLRGILGAKH